MDSNNFVHELCNAIESNNIEKIQSITGFKATFSNVPFIFWKEYFKTVVFENVSNHTEDTCRVLKTLVLHMDYPQSPQPPRRPGK